MKWWHKLLISLGVGYILFFFSESMFWARFKPEDTLEGLFGTWLVYSACGFVLLMLIDRFRIDGFWALFLAGGLFGWLVEGVVVQTVYEELPYSISFTALSWHGLISVIVGVYLLRRALVLWPWWGSLLLSLGLGIVEGGWAIWWWREAPPTPPWAYFAFIGIGTLLLMFWMWVIGRMPSGRFSIHRRWLWIALALISLVFFLVAMLIPVAALVLPPLVLLTMAALSQYPKIASEEGLFTWYTRPVKGFNWVTLALMPLAAAGVYTLAYRARIDFPSHQMVFVLTMPAGFILWLVGLVKIFSKAEGRADSP